MPLYNILILKGISDIRRDIHRAKCLSCRHSARILSVELCIKIQYNIQSKKYVDTKKGMKGKGITVSGNIVDVLSSEIYPGTLQVLDGKIVDIIRDNKTYATHIIPGFVDAHLHIESSMLVPSELARAAVIHGTVATVSDPHEIANVLGVDGVKYMIDDSRTVPLKFCFGVPSCVPASDFETSGAVLDPGKIEELFKLDGLTYLSEMMNFPGVINHSPDVMRKIEIAKQYGRVIDGHAPGLRGEALRTYIQAGISTDHESYARDEALEKLRNGMKIIIREGSAARNFNELIPIAEEYYKKCMFCTDDKHPNELVQGHINDLVKRAVDFGIDVIKVLRIACVNPVLHYKLDVGLLKVGDSADFLVVNNLKDFHVLKTYIGGVVHAVEGKSIIERSESQTVNNFSIGEKRVEDFGIQPRGSRINIIEAIEGQVITGRSVSEPRVEDGNIVSDVQRDILKIAVVNRYRDSSVSVGFVKNYGLKKGAIASSVAHDSHNIIAVGVTDRELCRAVNIIIKNKGGISAVSQSKEMVLPLPIAGIMSKEDNTDVAEKYSVMDRFAKELGSTLHAPFMTLSFMALLVIPKLKLSDEGLFDGEKFKFTDVFET
jgi:adenine deaminase